MADVVETREVDMTVDKLCWRYYGAETKTTEMVLAANPGLADLGPILPLGTRVLMPDPPAKEPLPLVNLWD